MNGVLACLKPPGPTSHDIVAAVRRRAQVKVGHLGTLDPAAAGVLVLVLGPATRLTAFAQGWEKTYVADVWLGIETHTDDDSGRPVGGTSAERVSRARVEDALRAFVGRIRQRPPAVSAVKVGGQRLYRRNRNETVIEATEREVWVRSLELLAFEPGRRARVRLRVTTGKGVYVRALARDLGRALGVGGTMGFLLRTRVGPVDVAQTVTVEEWSRDPRVLPAATLLAGLDRRHLEPGSDPPFTRAPLALTDARGRVWGVLEPGVAGPGRIRRLVEEDRV